MSAELYAKLTTAFWGFVLGAGAAMIIGFAWGGWTTAITAKQMGEEAVMTSRVSICVAQFMNGANNKDRLKEFQAMESYQRGEFIEKGGWDRMPGQEKATWGVASACVAGLETRIKAGA